MFRRLIPGIGGLMLALLLTFSSTPSHPEEAGFDSARFNATQGPLELLRITPSGEDVPAGHQIVFHFNRPVVPVGRMERTAQEIPISITPALACEWRWLNTSALACQLGEKAALKPATRYHITVRPGIKTEDGQTLAQAMEHDFVTERPAIRYTRFTHWASPGTPQIVVMFNQPVARDSVAEHLYMQHRGTRVPLQVEPDPAVLAARQRLAQQQDDEADDYMGAVVEGARALLFSGQGPSDADKAAYAQRSWLVMPKQALPLDAQVSLDVEPGIRSDSGPETGTEARTVISFDTFPEFRFLGVRCTYQALFSRSKPVLIQPGDDPEDDRCNPLETKALVFSAPVAKDTIKQALSVTPNLAGGRSDYDPWADVYAYASLSMPHQRDREYTVNLPEHMKAYELYHLQAKAAALTDLFGRPLPADLDMRFATDHRLPEFHLNHPVSVLESGEDTHLPVVVTNLKNIELEYVTLTPKGRQKERDITWPVDQAEDIAYHYPLKLRELIGAPSGAIQGRWSTSPKVDSEYHYSGLPNWFFSQVTPFHVHTKFGHYSTLVWVTRLDNGQPVANARIQVYTDRFGTFSDNPAIGAEAVTDANGLARLPGTTQLDPDLQKLNSYRGTDPRLFVRVLKGDDMALLPLTGDYNVETRGANDSHIPSYREKPFGHIHTWGFTAQGVYKAGDTIQYKLFVRDQDEKRFVAAPREGYTLQIEDPTGNTVHEIKPLTLSAFSSHAGEYTVPESGAVGWYRFKLKANFTSEEWEPLRVLVSDFTPAAFKVATDLNGKLFKPGDELAVTTQASLHAGGPYVEAQTRISVMAEPTSLNPADPRAKGFYFSVFDHAASHTLHQHEASVDNKGLLEMRFTIPEAPVLYGQLKVESAVRDDRGKYIANTATARFVGRDRYVGLRQADWLLQTGKPAELQALVVDEQGQLAADSAIEVDVHYQETTAARVKGAGNAYITRYTHEWVSASKCQLTSQLTPTVCRFTPDKPGAYRFTATIKDTRGRSHQGQVQRWALGAGQVLWETEPGNSLQMIPEKTEYKVGETARFLIQNPYPGARALVTVERFGVQHSEVRTFPDSTALVEIPVTADALPGFYVSVVVMSPRVEKPLGDNQVDLGKPAFRMGYARITVNDPAKQLDVKIKSRQSQYKPRDTVTIDLHATGTDQTELAVAVLDEAVFDLIQDGRDYFDPYKGFYRLDALDLTNFNLLTRLIGRQKFEKKGANTGGDGGPDLSLRSVFKFVSYWNPDVKLDKQGKATLTFPAPDNLTGWRVLAIAVTPEDRMGLGEGRFTVNQQTEIRPALPNQVTEGDRFEARFTIMNRTDASRRLVVNIEAEGEAVGDTQRHTQTVTAEPFKRTVISLPVKTVRAGDMLFRVQAGDEQDSDGLQVPLTVNRRQAVEAAATYGTSTSERVTETILFPQDMRTDVGRVSIVASPTVIGGLEGAFKYLRDYPYTCWEQRLTQGVMAAHYHNLKAYLPASFEWKGSKALPQAMLNKAADFQAPNGGMVYFIAQDRYADPYLSAYTAIAFNWLKASGYRVPADVEDKLHEYLLTMLRRDVLPDFYSGGMASTVRAVALAALAEHGKVTTDDTRRYRRHVPQMSLFGQAHYLMALVRVNDSADVRREVADRIRSHANETGGKLVFSEQLDFAYQRILDSSLRTNCAVLSAYLTHEDPAHGGRASDAPFKLVSTITQGRKQRDRWENTQENMFCLNALVEYSRVYEKDKPRMTLTAMMDDKALGQVRFNDFKDEPKDFERPIDAGDRGRKAQVSLERAGKGRYYYATRLFYSPAILKPQAINAGIEVQREYHVERGGMWVLLASPMTIRAGELVRVDLYASLPAARNFVVVDDPVPGGLEPVNRDLATASVVDADKGKFKHGEGSFWYRFGDWQEYGLSYWSFYHQELRHHAARFYADYLPAGRYHLSYTAQAIAPGEFAVMPVHAEEMYNPDTFGQSEPAELKVEPAP